MVNNLGPFLDRLQSRYNRAEFLRSDPLEFVHRFEDPWDKEAVALLAALLAYGNVKQIRRSVQALLDRIIGLGGSPAEFVRRLEDLRFIKAAEASLAGFVHRFNRGPDLLLLLLLLERSWARFGSLGAHFLTHHDPRARDFGPALAALISDWRSWVKEDFAKRHTGSFGYLLTSPSDGSCCKRWCMFLRWMGRSDELDPGLWASKSPLAHGFPEGRSLESRQLVIPLDTHTGRISQYLGLTRRKTLDWKAAVEVTSALRKVSPSDPVRYDFALSRLGILELCQRRYRKEICERCELVSACSFGKRKA